MKLIYAQQRKVDGMKFVLRREDRVEYNATGGCNTDGRQIAKNSAL